MTKKTTRLEDLAKKAGVSVSTASRALNDSPSVNMRTKQAIWKLAREMDYPFRRHMPAGPIGAKATVSVVVPRPQGRDTRLSDPFLLELLAGIGDAARDRECDVHISHVAPASYDDLVVAMTTHRAEGVIFVGQSTLHGAFNRLAETEGRFVVWGAELPEQRYCSIGSDNVRGGQRASEHLLRLGRKRIAFIGQSEAPEVVQRFRGYQQALENNGRELIDELVVDTHFDIESAEASVDALIKNGVEFDGIIAASDVIALGAIRALQHAGKRVPEDVAVVGYDNISFSRYANPALTTVDQDMQAAGRMMLSKLLDFRGPQARRSERLATDLIVRESCGG
ncbi:LacI family DNA-binding transcriptional regulator [Maricaulis sp.]|uniref:LacI family DNA-binding transcriptional regulator n=1 Tax=Maricaulis sp. TaxID=1486257 RepID=UPI002629F6C2|nr:LacI family DNA-binding transcriptional regulator [Maricaulis sp.]